MCVFDRVKSVGGATTGLSHEGAFRGREMGSFAFEKHYRVKELAGLWGLSAKTVARLFGDEAGVIRVANEGAAKRKYATLSIPESIALRVHERLGNHPLEATLAGCHPLRVIRLSDLHAGVSEKARNIVKLKPAQQLAHSKCVP